MPSSKPSPTAADHLVSAASPLLIMALVGSLLFFLVEVLYGGEFRFRVLWTSFFFVFGAVLIARISMSGAIAGRTGVYVLLLGGVVSLALWVHADLPLPIGFGLMSLVWWCAHRLTWDCTFIDSSVEASGAGLLEAAGLDRPRQAGGDGEGGTTTPATQAAATHAHRSDPPGFAGWQARYRRYREAQEKEPHTPGVWVVYFSLAALPLFGLGQSLIPAAAAGRRQFVFWLMTIYVASGLGLLLTTSFLGTRRYLRQRKLQMPAPLAGAWLGLGAALVVALLAAAAVLPRPHSDHPLFAIDTVGSKERDASSWSPFRDSPGKGPGRGGPSQRGGGQRRSNRPGDQGSGSGGRSSASNAGQAQAQGSSGQSRNANSGEGGDSSGSSQNSSQQTGGSQSGSPDKGQPTNNAQDRGGQDSQAGASKQGDPSSGQRSDGQGADKNGDSSRNPDAADKDKDRQDDRDAGSSGGSQAMADRSPPKEDPAADEGKRADSRPESSGGFLEPLGVVADVLKWLIFCALALLAAFVVLRAALLFLANFTFWANDLSASWRAFWDEWTKWWRRDAAPEEEEDLGRVKPPRPFDWFRNPFRDGTADRTSPEEVIRYSFDALQSWSWERGLARQPEETPREFAERLGEERPDLWAETHSLANLYAQATYSAKTVPAGRLGPVRKLWQLLEGGRAGET